MQHEVDREEEAVFKSPHDVLGQRGEPTPVSPVLQEHSYRRTPLQRGRCRDIVRVATAGLGRGFQYGEVLCNPGKTVRAGSVSGIVVHL